MSHLRLGVLGGTFDPIHYGHLRVAESAREALHLDRVLLVPAGVPPHKPGRVLTGAMHRLVMSELATASNSQFEVSFMEVERPGPSFTYRTLEQLHETHPVGTEIFFILGADAVLEINTWKLPARVLELCDLAVCARPGFAVEQLREVAVPGLAERTRLVEGPVVNISSTEIRSRVRRGSSIRYLTPEPVEAYIRKMGLYRGEGNRIDRDPSGALHG